MVVDKKYEQYNLVRNGTKYKEEVGQLWRQYIIAGIASVSSASVGFVMGWTSPVNPKLANITSTPLPDVIDENQGAWIGSLLTVGAMFGPLLGGIAASAMGRKRGILSTTIPLLVGWALIASAQNVLMIYAGRVFWGFTAGMVFTILPMYCSEIATDDARGAVGSYLNAFLTLGLLLVYSVGPFASYATISYVGIIVVVAFICTFIWMPESPMYYLMNNERHAAARSLAFLRGKSIAGVQSELDHLHDAVTASQATTASLTEIFRGSNNKAFYIMLTMIVLQQLSGINAVLFYMTNIFMAAGSDIKPDYATIIIGVIQVAASLMTPFVADRFGRRPLMMISSAGTTLGLALLGMFFILDEQKYTIVKSMGCLPILALILFVVTHCWGIGPLPWAIMGEVFPMEVKAIASPIVTTFTWVLCFLVTRYFSLLAIAVGMGATFLIFGVFCTVFFFFTLFVVPETKGKSLQEIQDMLAGRPKEELPLKLIQNNQANQITMKV